MQGNGDARDAVPPATHSSQPPHQDPSRHVSMQPIPRWPDIVMAEPRADRPAYDLPALRCCQALRSEIEVTPAREGIPSPSPCPIRSPHRVVRSISCSICWSLLPPTAMLAGSPDFVAGLDPRQFDKNTLSKATAGSGLCSFLRNASTRVTAIDLPLKTSEAWSVCAPMRSKTIGKKQSRSVSADFGFYRSLIGLIHTGLARDRREALHEYLRQSLRQTRLVMKRTEDGYRLTTHWRCA